jgi:SAM-dependent methyltransferase
MPSAVASFPLVIPPDARRALGTEDFARRVGKVCGLGSGARVLELGSGGSSLVLAREFGCKLVCADANETALDALRTRLSSVAGGERVEVKKLPPDALPFEPKEFAAIVMLEKVLRPLDELLTQLRPHLAESGHLAIVYPVAVGRKSPPVQWAEALGVPLLLPRDCFRAFEKNGFEPISVDSLSEQQLDTYYEAVEESLRRFPEKDPRVSGQLRAQLEAHAAHKKSGSITWACLIGRRKEPGEKPPQSRDSG